MIKNHPALSRKQTSASSLYSPKHRKNGETTLGKHMMGFPFKSQECVMLQQTGGLRVRLTYFSLARSEDRS